MDVQIYRLLSVISYTLAGVFLIAAIVLFFALKIPRAIGYVYGKLNTGNIKKKQKSLVKKQKVYKAEKTRVAKEVICTAKERKEITGITKEKEVTCATTEEKRIIGTTIEEKEVTGTTVEEKKITGTTVEEDMKIHALKFIIVEDVVIVHTDKCI